MPRSSQRSGRHAVPAATEWCSCGRQSAECGGRCRSRRQALELTLAGGLVVAVVAESGRRAYQPAQAPLHVRAEFGLASAASTGGTRVNNGIHDAEQRLGATLPIAGCFINFDTEWAAKQDMWDDFAGQQRTLNLAWGPVKFGETVRLKDISDGKYRDHVDDILRGVASYRHPVVCRWGWEMNGDWSEYSAAYQGEKKGGWHPTEYVDAWRYVVERARALDVPNIKWLFCPNGSDVGDFTMEEYWPGREYVDVVGADAYNGFGDWTSFYDLFAPSYGRLLSLKPEAEFWVGETGSIEATDGSMRKAAWLTDMFSETRLLRLRAVNYFDDIGSRDWRITSSPSSLAAFAAGCQQSVDAHRE